MQAKIWRLGLAALASVGIGGAAQALTDAPAPEPRLLELDDVAVPIVDHGQIEGKLYLRAMFNLSADEAQETADARKPVLQAAVRAAASEHARLYATPSQAVDQVRLAKQLEAAARQVGAKGQVVILEAVSRSG